MNTSPTTDMSAYELLSWQLAMGVDETIGDEPIDHFKLAQQAAEEKAKAKTTTAPTTTAQQAPPNRATPPKATLAIPTSEGIALASKAAKAANSLSELKSAIEDFAGCGLVKTAMNTVFADGCVDAEVMIIGDSPNSDEDRMGKPFAGEAGQLLDKMMAAIGLERTTGFYATTIIPWRPPGNRPPSPDELAICLPFVTRHIELAKPKILFVMGHTAIATLLNDTTPTKNLRGKWRKYELDCTTIDVMPSYHPSRLLKQPQTKRDSWQDLLEIKSKLGE